MRILIVGGSVFLGRQLVIAARNAGHELTLFNRGNNSLPEQDAVEKIKGNRNNLEQLQGRSWDAVIDTCGMKADEVGYSAKQLLESCSKYVFISSVSAYADLSKEAINEDADTKLTPRDQIQDYGSEKAWSEKAVLEQFTEQRSLIIRPGVLVGRYDPKDRLTYWVRRISRGGQVLAPGRPEREVQFIDIRDTAEWIVRLLEAQLCGTFNLTGPFYPYTMDELLRTCIRETSSNAELAWASDEQLAAAKVAAWTELPLWLPDSDQEHSGLMKIDCLKAQNTGLSYRAVHETIDDTFDWDKTREPNEPLNAGLSAEREQEILNLLSTL